MRTRPPLGGEGPGNEAKVESTMTNRNSLKFGKESKQRCHIHLHAARYWVVLKSQHILVAKDIYYATFPVMQGDFCSKLCTIV